MNTLAVIIRSQLIRLWRSKALLIVALVGPLLVLLLAALAFDSTTYGLKVGAYVPQESDLTADVLTTLEGNHVIIKTYDSEGGCMDAVRASERQACLLFSAPFGVTAANNTITIVIDGSNLALAGIISEGVYGSIERQSATLSTDLVAQLVSALEEVRIQTAEGKTTLVKIATSTNNAVEGLRTSQGTVGVLNTSFAVTDISVATLNSADSQLVNASTVSTLAAQDALLRVTNLIASATAAVASSNVSQSDKNMTNGYLRNISAAMNTTLQQVQTVNTSVGASSILVRASATNIAGQLDALKAKVDAIAGAKTGIINALTAVEAQLNQALVDVTGLQQSLDAMDDALKGVTVTDPSRVSKPIRAFVRPLPVASRLASVFPALLVLVVAFGGLLIAPRLVHMERHSGALVRMSLIPFPREVQAIATIITGLVLVGAQALVLVIVSALFFAQAAPLSTVGVLLLAGLLFVLLGNCVSYLFETEEAAMLATLSIGTALLVIAGIIIPIEFMPSTIQAIAAYNPVLLAAGALRQTAVFGLSIVEASGVFALIVGIVIAAAAAYGALLFSRAHSVEKLIEGKN